MASNYFSYDLPLVQIGRQYHLMIQMYRHFSQFTGQSFKHGPDRRPKWNKYHLISFMKKYYCLKFQVIWTCILKDLKIQWKHLLLPQYYSHSEKRFRKKYNHHIPTNEMNFYENKFCALSPSFIKNCKLYQRLLKIINQGWLKLPTPIRSTPQLSFFLYARKAKNIKVVKTFKCMAW